MSSTTSHFSLVLETPPARPEEAHRHFLARLALETDAADVRLDLQRGQNGFVLLDARGAQDFEECHIPGAINLPYRQITAASTAHLSQEQPIVVYCWSPGCNAATKAAARLSVLGFQVKEMLGGIEYWRREDGPVEGTLGERAPLVR
ncbi:MAG TPA: rhodanese-like domain-containing protein [Ktedonobacteraceae bacterium]